MVACSLNLESVVPPPSIEAEPFVLEDEEVSGLCYEWINGTAITVISRPHTDRAGRAPKLDAPISCHDFLVNPLLLFRRLLHTHPSGITAFSSFSSSFSGAGSPFFNSRQPRTFTRYKISP
jgi:hypothetical protein